MIPLLRTEFGVTRRTRAGRSLIACAAVLASALVAAPDAGADVATDRSHDPIGAVGSVAAVPGGIRFTGWAADPDELTTNVTVGVLIDGRKWAVTGPTSLARPKVTARQGTGPTPGFSLTTPIDALPHTACVVALNLDGGMHTVLKCVPTPLGTTLTADQLATHDPRGRIERAEVHPTWERFQGWASDPDFVGRRSIVVLYIDGLPAATVVTHRYPAPRPDGAGYASAFDITVPVSTGMHIGCIWVVNVGLGDNALLGCRARDTRGPAGTAPVVVPSLNKKVVLEAKSHIGEPYVWGAEGPHRFDCSGLVQYSYGKFGFSTPRVSEDQARMARLIPAARAVPGDLAFYHDTEGDVYHVGIYLKPGLTVAAIDTDHGVNYQKIWDPASTTYGSFTHT
jgi:hypothetical protein